MSAQPVFERDRPLTWEDLQGIPDDRYWGHEIVAGQLLVSPLPGTRHQSCVGSVAVLLRAACPPDLKVFVAPYDYAPRPGYSLQPDVLVARRADVGRQRLEHTPVLVVEVLSPNSRVTDRSLKRLVYEEHGVPHYWLGSATGAQPWTADAPFSVTVVPAELLDE